MYIVIGGGGMVGGELAHELIENKHDVVLIDGNKSVCDKVYAETGAIVINGSASQIEVLKEAGAEKADVVVAATANDADNLACAILAKSYNVPQIIVRMRNPAYENAYKVAGVQKIVRVTDLMVNQMMVEIENPKLRRIATIGNGKASIFIVTIPENAKNADKNIKDITDNRRFPDTCTFVGIYNPKSEEFAIPRGNEIINEGDEIFLISTEEDITKAVDFLTG
ncbi:MAG: TrkA family potassium uptake protein [Planctomycetes bacterium]|nr:TrkA family potassium uptake protein [Planctomycetota bacterium]